jgi:hypothetical protein
MLQTLPRALSKDDCIGHRQRRHGRDHADGGLLLAAKQASFSLLARHEDRELQVRPYVRRSGVLGVEF